MLKNGQPPPCIAHSYEQHKGDIIAVLRKLVLKERVGYDEWQNLFHHVHMVCSWDANGPQKLIKCIEREFYTCYIAPLKDRLKSVDDGYQQLKEYVEFWVDFRRHCDRLPMAFQQLDLATSEALLKGKFHSSTSFQPPSDDFNKFGTLSSGNKKQTRSLTQQQQQQQQQQQPQEPPKATHTMHVDPKNKNQYSLVRCVILRLWAEKILNPNIDRLMNSTRELIMRERCGFIIDSTLIIGLCESLAHLDTLRIINYHQDHMRRYEAMYVESVGLFYSPIPDEYIREHGVIDYISWALEKLEREGQKAVQYLQPNSEAIKRVGDACNSALIRNFVDQIAHASIEYIQTRRIECMRLIYKFFNNIEGLVEIFLEELYKHFVSSGLAHLIYLDSHAQSPPPTTPQPALLSSGRPDLFVEKLLEIHSDFDVTIRAVFGDDPRAGATLERALGAIINDPRIFHTLAGHASAEHQPPGNEQNMSASELTKSDPESRCAELLAQYCSILFRRSPLSRKLSTEDFNHRLDQLHIFIKLLKNKEAFIRLHKLHLVKRLIPDASNNLEKEEEFVTRLRDVPGVPLDEINELLRMFKDLKTSELLGNKFNKIFKPSMNNVNNNNTISNISSQMTDRLSIDEASLMVPPISIKVLNPNAWSKNFDTSPITMPSNILMVMPIFEEFYKDQYEGRELEWCSHLSTGIVCFKNNEGNKYELEVTAAQLSILYSFNEQPQSLKTLNELRLLSNLSVHELRRTIWSLVSNPKLKRQILNCDPPIMTQKDLDRPTNMYSVNQNFVLM